MAGCIFATRSFRVCLHFFSGNTNAVWHPSRRFGGWFHCQWFGNFQAACLLSALCIFRGCSVAGCISWCYTLCGCLHFCGYVYVYIYVYVFRGGLAVGCICDLTLSAAACIFVALYLLWQLCCGLISCGFVLCVPGRIYVVPYFSCLLGGWLSACLCGCIPVALACVFILCIFRDGLMIGCIFVVVLLYISWLLGRWLRFCGVVFFVVA